MSNLNSLSFNFCIFEMDRKHLPYRHIMQLKNNEYKVSINFSIKRYIGNISDFVDQEFGKGSAWQ